MDNDSDYSDSSTDSSSEPETHVHIDTDVIQRLPFHVDCDYWIHKVQPAILKTGQFKTTDNASRLANLVLLADALNYDSRMEYLGDNISSVVIKKKVYLYGK